MAGPRDGVGMNPRCAGDILSRSGYNTASGARGSLKLYRGRCVLWAGTAIPALFVSGGPLARLLPLHHPLARFLPLDEPVERGGHV